MVGGMGWSEACKLACCANGTKDCLAAARGSCRAARTSQGCLIQQALSMAPTCCRNIQVPGFSSKDVKPYTRLQPSMDHQRRMAAVRKAMAAAASSSTKDGGVASSAAVAAGVGAPAVANGVAGGQAPAEPGARAAEPEPAAATAGDGGDGGATGAAERSPAGGKARGKAPGKQQQAAEDVDMPNLDAAAADGEP